MKVLYLSSWSPYPCLSGGRQRTKQLLEALQNIADVVHISFAAGPVEKELLKSKDAYPIDYQYQTSYKALPPSLWPFQSPAVLDLLSEMGSEGVDVTLFDQIFCTGHLDHAPGKLVLMEHNVESNLLRQQAAFLEPAKKRLGLAQFMALKAYENKTWPKFDLRSAVSEEDAQEMRSRCPGPTVVSPNGVDLQRATALKLPSEPRLLFVGALDFGPNDDAVHHLIKDIMPLVWSDEPSMKLRVLGRNPSGELREAMNSDDRLELFANLPQLEPKASECAISVVPLRMGSGTRLKILEASAWTMPVVTTSVGCEGLESSLTQHLNIADGAEAFAQAVVRAWRDPAGRVQQGQAARSAVARSYAWSETLKPLLQGLQELTC